MTDKHSVKKDYGGAVSTGVAGLLVRVFVPIILFVMGRIPLAISQAFGFAVVKLIGILFPGSRRLVKENLRQVVGDSMSEKDLDKLVWENMRHAWALRYVDMASVPRFDKAYIKKHVTFSGAEKYLEAVEQGKGVILVSLHLGCPLITFPAAIPSLGPILMGGARRIFDDKTSAILKSYLETHGIIVQWSDYAMEPMMEHLAKGGVILVVGDHVTSPRGIRVSFFGRDTLMPAGPAITALRTNAILIPMYGVRTSARDVYVEFGDPIDVPSTPEKIGEEELLEVMNQYISFFETAVSKYPEQWESYTPHWPKSFSEEDLYVFKSTFGVVHERPKESEVDK